VLFRSLALGYPIFMLMVMVSAGALGGAIKRTADQF
jgi:hypothetical protein